MRTCRRATYRAVLPMKSSSTSCSCVCTNGATERETAALVDVCAPGFVVEEGAAAQAAPAYVRVTPQRQKSCSCGCMLRVYTRVVQVYVHLPTSNESWVVLSLMSDTRCPCIYAHDAAEAEQSCSCGCMYMYRAVMPLRSSNTSCSRVYAHDATETGDLLVWVYAHLLTSTA